MTTEQTTIDNAIAGDEMQTVADVNIPTKPSAALSMFTIRDTKAGTHALPFFRPNVALAKRDAETMTRHEGSMTFHHPEDFTLYEIGWFDPETAEVHTFTRPANHGGLDSLSA